MAFSISKLLFGVIVAALLSQGAAATWYTGGSFEPDNGLDDSTFMYFDPPGTATDQIYFNVYSGTWAGAVIVNQNAGALETRVRPLNLEYHIATLGVWVDCNGDGYVGSALGAAREYPASLLADTTMCPAVTGPANNWTAGAPNYNGWVSEFVPIGSANSADRRAYNDGDAMVWGDYNRPTDPSTGGGSCALAPQPRGTYQSTGGLLNYLDCGNGVMEAWNAPWNGTRLLAQNFSGLNDFGIDLGLKFDDPDNASGSWADGPTFGTEDESRSPAYVYDCDAEPTRSGDVLNDTPVGPLAPNAAHNIQVYAIAPRMGGSGTPPPLGDGATIPALLNHTYEGTVQDCDTSNDAGHDFYGAKAFYVGEDDFNSVSGANKREADFNFGYSARQRGHFGALVGGAAPMAGSGGYNLGPNYSDWRPGVITLTGGPTTLRIDLVEGVTELPAAGYLTFYAHVGTNTTGRGFVTPGGSGTYASAQCGEETSGIHNGWNCDPNTWYRNPDGTPVPEPLPLARPGQVYELRDVDCFDGAIGDSGVGVSTQYYGEEACP